MAFTRPNVLIIFTDMQRADTIHALGNDIILTPNLDRLVGEGVAFTSCYSPSPVCVPARCCMQYGLYPQKTGVFDNENMMTDNGKAYPAILGEYGYRTHAIGKCHFTPDSNALRGFQSRQTQEEGVSNPDDDDYVGWLHKNGYDHYEPHGARGEMYYIPQVSTLPIAAHPSNWIGSESVRFIREQNANGESGPWCLFSSFIHPHPPFAPPKPWHKLYRAPDMPPPFLPKNSQELMTWVNRLQNRYKYRDNGMDINLLRVIKAYYYATISFVDFQIGRILQTLEETGQLEKTLIVFASDHGEHLGDFYNFGKRSMHEAAARVPMLVRYPSRFEAGVRCSSATSLVDLFPTVLGAAGIPSNNLELDGVDLADVAQGAGADRTVFSQYASKGNAIYMALNANWKYVFSAGDNKEFLFDRRSVNGDTQNLANKDDMRNVLNEMKQIQLRYLKSVGANDVLTEKNGLLDWKRYPLVDETYLQDPDEKLLYQDHPYEDLEAPEYIKKLVRTHQGFLTKSGGGK